MPIERASVAEQIANQLRADIEAGELGPGDKLPSDTVLAERFGVSKPTVTKARGMLVALRLVESRAGAASTVRDISRDGVPAGNQLQRARRTGRIYPEGHYARILAAQVAPAPPEVATALHLSRNASAIERHRITFASDDTPLSTSTSYFSPDLAESCPALLRTDRIEQGTTLYIDQQTGRTPASIACSVWSRAADAATSEQLRLARGAYVLAVATTTYDSDGDTIAYEVELHPPDTPVVLDISGV